MTTHRTALIFELDGVAIPKVLDARPTKSVIEAIGRAKKYATVFFATNRSWVNAKKYANELGIKSLCITLGGAQVVDSASDKVIWEQDLDPGVAPKIIEMASNAGIKAFNYETQKFINASSLKVAAIESIVTLLAPSKTQNEILKQIKKIPLLNVEVSNAIEKDMVQIAVKHIYATKFMALQAIAKKLKFEPKLSVGVGESATDITLLNFCGIKVAMGSSIARLKELAQHIAPGVKEDGLVWVIDKFIVPKKS
jgi:hydroxymethylpyrimidine pyrophosphatase-like HAD family hydrolase